MKEEPTIEEQEQQPLEQPSSTMAKIERTAVEAEQANAGQLSLRTILGGDILTAQLVKSQIWLFLLIVVFVIVYVAFRYQCQQDMLDIDKLEKELVDAKYKALSSSSSLTEKCRESRVLQLLKANRDSVLHTTEQPPFIINVPEEQ